MKTIIFEEIRVVDSWCFQKTVNEWDFFGGDPLTFRPRMM